MGREVLAMKITLNIPDNLSTELIEQCIQELEAKLVLLSQQQEDEALQIHEQLMVQYAQTFERLAQ